ncbi:hypothetical protein MOQ_002195 [Trypanosoma cruzi marinkellei]|uniref:Uncharacterized protein n=1 Tax=Trypanosoma cruzi marinkellei TaxID=85056 RepID=K2P959_TRYCR|nr:hypothetical protein MOQ_002195 [Trypanosoma cruzi marinkellei]
MGSNPVELSNSLTPHGKMSLQDHETSTSSSGGPLGIALPATPRTRSTKMPGSTSSSSLRTSLQGIKVPKRRFMPAAGEDPVMKRLQFRYATKPKERMYAKVPTAVNRLTASAGGELRSEVEASTAAVHQETVGMLCRNLPLIADPSKQMEAVLGSIEPETPQKIANLDDRITPQTLYTLLHRGRALANKMASKRKATEVLEDMKKFPNTKLDDLRTQVARLEPPYVDQMLQAKVFNRPQNDEDLRPREAFPITLLDHEDKKPKWQSEQECRSHIVAPPPTRQENREVRHKFSFLSPSTQTGDTSENVAAALTVPLTLSTGMGDDIGIIDQVVAYASARRRPEIGGVSSDAVAGIPRTHPSYNPVFSALDAVLAVSKEYEKVQQTWPGASTKHMSASRQSIIDRIASWESSRIPRSLWVSISDPTFPGSRLHRLDEDTSSGAPKKSSVVFPAVKATGRAQVYLLADALDRMFQEIPDTLAVLADRETAKILLPEAPETDGLLVYRDVADVERIMNLKALQESDSAHRKYVEAAEKVMEVVDVGLVEIIRQVAGSCKERGALLDVLRLLIKDVTSSCLWLIGYCKDQARREVKARLELIQASKQDVEEVMNLREEVKKRKQEEELLRGANAELEQKASKYDTLIDRLKVKDKNFSRHPVHKHLRLLMELEENYTQMTTKGLEELYKRQNAQPSDEPKLYDAPTTHMEIVRQEEEQIAQEELYTESYRLLSAVTEALRVVDLTCEPLYDRIALPPLGPTSRIASMRWAEIASAVGSYEVEKKHRQHVFELFARWNEMQGKTGTTLVKPSGLEEEITDPEAPQSPEVESPQKKATPSELQPLVPGTEVMDDVKKRVQFITRKDLTEMGVTDCSPDEINAMYSPDFDIAAFLRIEYNPPAEYEMNPKILRDMVHDVTEVLRHVTLRMNALANSGLVREGVKPPMPVPAHPEDPCTLCGRRDRVAIEKKSRSETMQRVASEIQRRYDEMVKKCQRAESERENYRREIQRFQIRERKQMEDWEFRENELRRENAVLLEENRRLAQQAYSLGTSLGEVESEHGTVAFVRNRMTSDDLSSSSEEFTSEYGDEEDEQNGGPDQSASPLS